MTLTVLVSIVIGMGITHLLTTVHLHRLVSDGVQGLIAMSANNGGRRNAQASPSQKRRCNSTAEATSDVALLRFSATAQPASFCGRRSRFGSGPAIEPGLTYPFTYTRKPHALASLRSARLAGL